MRTLKLWFLSLCLLLITACREDEFVSVVTDQIVSSPTQDSFYSGIYVLCEGNMGANKCTLDYLDLDGRWSGDRVQTHYYRNIYASQNPHSVLELGDVGNDLAIYGSRLWMVINASNKVEVCRAADAVHIGQIQIANARYLAFKGGYAYVSSYAGPMQLGEDSPRGRVYKVDTLSLQKVDSVTVGFQPEEMVVVDDYLLVANSGGYRAPHYDNTVCVINLNADPMIVEQTLEVGTNLHRMQATRSGEVWVSSRGDYSHIAPSLYGLRQYAKGRFEVVEHLELPVSAMQAVGDSLYFISAALNSQTGITVSNMGLLNTHTRSLVATPLFDAPEVQRMKQPYGLLVNPMTHDIYLMDAKNYVSSGTLLHVLADGTFDWQVSTGDIPSKACLLPKKQSVLPADYPTEPNNPVETDTLTHSPYILAVDEYVPAPGQFVNTLPVYEVGDNADTMVRKCTELLAKNAGGTVTLGGWGGYITFHFDHPVRNLTGSLDLQISGNAHEGGSEAGIVMVSVDQNHNGKPDDLWYELCGSAETESRGPVTYDYELTYKDSRMSDVIWKDNLGGEGLVRRNPFHTQDYYPLWITGDLTFRGTRLPDNGEDVGGDGKNWRLNPFGYGYVDNQPIANYEANCFDLDWAVDPQTRKPVKLDKVHFVRVYTALNQYCGWLGETSTEITGAEDLHP